MAYTILSGLGVTADARAAVQAAVDLDLHGKQVAVEKNENRNERKNTIVLKTPEYEAPVYYTGWIDWKQNRRFEYWKTRSRITGGIVLVTAAILLPVVGWRLAVKAYDDDHAQSKMDELVVAAGAGKIDKINALIGSEGRLSPGSEAGMAPLFCCCVLKPGKCSEAPDFAWCGMLTRDI